MYAFLENIYIFTNIVFRLNLAESFLRSDWVPEIKEGFFDSNIWPYIIDSLWSRETTYKLLRKERTLSNSTGSERYDGVFRYKKKWFTF